MAFVRLLLSIARAAAVLAWTAFWISASLLLSVLTLDRDLPLKMARELWSGFVIRLVGGRIRVEALPALDWAKPHIFVMNHQSMVDIPVAFRVIPSNLRFLAKHSLKWVPFLGWYMAWTGMVFVNRSSRASAIRTMREAGQRIRQGASIIAFPEGTRSRTGEILPFKKGIFAVAIEAGVPIVPVAVHGSGQVLPRDSYVIRPGEIRFKLGQPIETAGRGDDRDALMAEVRAALIALHREIGGPGEPISSPHT